MAWQLIYTRLAQKDAQKLVSSGLKDKAKESLKVVENNPFQNSPPYRKLGGEK